MGVGNAVQSHDPKSVDLHFNPEDGNICIDLQNCTVSRPSVLTGLAHAALTEDHDLERLLT
jgi:hypothetical protein